MQSRHFGLPQFRLCSDVRHLAVSVSMSEQLLLNLDKKSAAVALEYKMQLLVHWYTVYRRHVYGCRWIR